MIQLNWQVLALLVEIIYLQIQNMVIFYGSVLFLPMQT